MNRKFLTVPFAVWILIGTIVPLVVTAYYGFTDRSGAFTVANLLAIASPEHGKSLLVSLLLSLISTLVCLVIAFPLAIILSRGKFVNKGFIIFIFILPMWMNFLLRTMAWQVLLERGGLINQLGSAMGFPQLQLIGTPGAVVLGMVYDFLPFMILPVFNSVSRIDRNIIEAAYDLGATKGKVLRSIIMPLSLPGIASGITMVFVPSLTTFAISTMLGGGKVYLIGNIIEQEFTVNCNWNLGAGLSLIMMLFIVISMALLSSLDGKPERRTL